MKSTMLAMLPYGKVEQWPTIPRAALFDRLSEKKIPFARSDESSAPPPFTIQVENGGVLFIDVEIDN
jgi:hypothetical protein